MPADLSRRRFIQGLAAGTALAGMGGLRPGPAFASPGVKPASLSGQNFDLEIGYLAVNFTGTPATATVVNGQLPAPTLYWREGDTVTLRVTNRLRHTSSIHWHGILLPYQMDGVPGFGFDGIAPGETFTYRFRVRQSGTYWYHSHSMFQEQTGLYGPLIVLPKDGERFPADREHVILFSDWTDEDPLRIYARLKKLSDYYNVNQPTVPDFFRDVATMGMSGALQKRRMWNRMRMNPADFSDVGSAAYTYLINGTTPLGNWTGSFRRGEKVKLRFINGSASTIFDVRIPGLRLTVVAADGQDVEPVTVDEFRVSVAETYDVLVEPEDDRAYTIFAQSIDRMGYARATLAPRAGMTAEVPPLDEPQWLDIQDMMGAMTHDAARMGAPDVSIQYAEHAMHHNHAHGGHARPAKANHARTEYGPGVDMRVDMPRTSLDDPGIHLRNNGRRVLTYADLHTIDGPYSQREPERDMELHLTGNMERFIWSFDGVKFADAKPLHFRYGEKLRVILSNDTMMNHPIHLHGMFSEVESPDGHFQVRKHTINVQPAQRVSFLVDATEPGRWAFHCHLLYHMEAGMFREVIVS
jgi:CopA family copper-resistance protein